MAGSIVNQSCEQSREKKISENLGLVYHVCKRYQRNEYDKEELFQVGCIGLMKAVDNFDTSFQVQFSTYAVPLIQGEIRRFLRDNGMVKVSRSIKENRYRIEQFRRYMEKEEGRSPTIKEISERCKISEEDIVLALNSYCEMENIEEQSVCYEGSDREQILNKVMVEQLLQSLSPLEKTLIQMRYFHGKTQTQTAAKLHMTQVQVSRLEKRILLSLRGKTHKGGNDT